MREAFLLARETLKQPAFAPFDAGEADPGSNIRTAHEIDAYIRSEAGSAYHPCGSAKMGASQDRMAVCDPEGRVDGVDGVRVCDASLMPSITSGNINAPTLMLAEKIAAAMTT